MAAQRYLRKSRCPAHTIPQNINQLAWRMQIEIDVTAAVAP